MTHDEIQKEWDSFIEYPDGSSKLYVTTTSALLFARHIAYMAADKEREACADILDSNSDRCDPHSIAYEVLDSNAAAIRARGNA